MEVLKASGLAAAQGNGHKKSTLRRWAFGVCAGLVKN